MLACSVHALMTASMLAHALLGCCWHHGHVKTSGSAKQGACVEVLCGGECHSCSHCAHEEQPEDLSPATCSAEEPCPAEDADTSACGCTSRCSYVRSSAPTVEDGCASPNAVAWTMVLTADSPQRSAGRAEPTESPPPLPVKLALLSLLQL
jgi:hypothetical protein